MTEATHFDQTPRRRAEFIKPPHPIKSKVGTGGLGTEVLARAQAILENNTTDFEPLAESYLATLNTALESARPFIDQANDDHEPAIVGLLYPTMQLKANGGMFHYPLVSIIADKKIQFLEVIEKIDIDVIELGEAFIGAIRAVLASKLHDTNDRRGRELVLALDDACRRYFIRHPANKNAD